VASRAFSLASLTSRARAQTQMKAPGVYAYVSQSLMKGTYTASVLELWGLWEAFARPWVRAEVQVQNRIRAAQAFAAQAFAAQAFAAQAFASEVWGVLVSETQVQGVHVSGETPEVRL